ncbi:porin family protein [Neolewinella litorea]|uniref:Outer membrane protein beta-barrel domain-containing protein n=1 Tax=Neolewinella litorea TaxID=2562452 RepID=A0A4V3XLF4_9BACT|nr:outer membrane beta-barrel protein [Neolewinella litorea]THH40633.1 hypothetical protein E4021_07845 [Neolewinella litorea]
MRFLLICFLLSSTLVSGQTLERSFGLELSPHYNHRRISGTNNITFNQLNRMDSLETGSAGFVVGLSYESRVDRIGYTTGVRYAQVGYASLEQEGAGSGGGTFSDRVTGHYLTLPFEINFYQDVTEKDRALFLLGVAGQYHLATRTRRTSFADGGETGSELLTDDASYRPVVLSLITGIGFDRKLSTDWAIRFQPTFQFFLNGNLRPDTDILANRNYYQVGLRVVVRRLFI